MDEAARPLSATSRTRLRRFPERGRTDRADLKAILDDGLMCFVGAVVEGGPRVIPMVYGRIDDTLYLHGSVANQVLTAARDGAELCVSVTDVDELVLANSLFHHSVNFRSVMIYGRGRLVTDQREQVAGLRAAADQLVPGRGATLDAPTRKQLAATLVIALPLDEASVKVRQGPPNGEVGDYDRPIWAGVLPLTQTWGEPLSDPKLRTATAIPDHVAKLAGQPLR
ncbi:pyridoxamine 5'-phosphate oxidase family protein [Nonomuraea mesophila]|uniref:Pyridoxamine 5'-phosphate oxidase family protein n=1 Tax=Nonomuraea mesophila TaxID=2530382 RepID=A0A4R5FIC2_9ACTN|nr:pyridoxamine 5'-phosphate oxidase family protein [Nonomuraea mesophila]TDE51465.1 pyridoxamine 5'-phosphate oxidase family protein [Nonomuraea mesophila]